MSYNILKYSEATNCDGYTREKNDYYATHPVYVPLLIEALASRGVKLNNNLYEPCNGEGHLSMMFEYLKYNMKKSDLIKRTKDVKQIDALKLTHEEVKGCDVPSNPPYAKIGFDIIKHLYSIIDDGALTCHLLPATYSFAKYKSNFLDEHPPLYIINILVNKGCAKHGIFLKSANSNQFKYCWYVWRKGNTNDTITFNFY